MGLIDDLDDRPVALDTAVFIYFIEKHEEFHPIVRPLFAAIDGGTLEAVTSALTLLEVLVMPYRVGDLALAGSYENALTRSRIRLVEIGPPQLRAAAQLRAVHRAIRTPDALQISAALSSGCSTFVTNDRNLPTPPGLRVLQIRDYAG